MAMFSSPSAWQVHRPVIQEQISGAAMSKIPLNNLDANDYTEDFSKVSSGAQIGD
jgi:hypothetical protein